MTRTLMIAATLLVASLASDADAQYATGHSIQAPPPGYTYVYPARPAYVRGYRAVVPQDPYPHQYSRPANPTGYRNRPYYGAYGYGNSGNGSTDGFPPFRGRGRR